MTNAQVHRSHGKARNAAHAHRKQSKPKRVVGTLRKDTEDPRSGMGDEVWQEMVATAAYLRAEARGFEGGSAEDDWYEAETELRGQLERAEEGTESVPDSGAGPADIEREGERRWQI
jgi:hypothetical protein